MKENSMKILMLSWEYPPRIVGGISRVVHDLSQKLGQKDNEVHIVTCWEPNTKEVEKDENVFVHRVHTYNINSNNFIDWVLQLNFSFLKHSIKLIDELGKFDIIHAHDWLTAFSAKTLKSAYTIPLVCTIHATEYGRNWGIHNDVQKYINNVEWWLTYESWRVIVNSNYMRNEVCHIFQLPQDKVRLIPNGIDIHKFDGLERDYEFRRNYADDNEKIIFFVGRLVHEKGAQILVEAMPKILNNYNNVKFIIAGRGAQNDHLRGKVISMNVSHKVYFTGYISEDDLLKMYKCADVAVFPSLYEPFGIVALESIVANVPIVVSDAGGLNDIVDHGINGMKAYAGNANSLADSILVVLQNPSKAEKMKRRAFDKIREKYNWDTISQQTISVYKEIVAEAQVQDWGELSIKEQLDK
jgi:glycogen synthase